ncbi:TPA: hypothetical protein K8N36_000895 [Clostridium perfringens]|uniref:Uncharacterized protein n=2 Tax=Clostridium perfringens TaxID=1502 RepID=A0AAV3FDL5_CLOPF|nr:hypothetical protein [Clostridium perfringens]UWG10045.1 MAG: hypothetical protein [Bacteriophage sp.]EIA17473.1 hypothetical protein HA1_06507 [Clostridium perfringens F262]MDM0592771.1 hypothetical protein [Clostridium perfringens]MDM0595770.1 hypothetical protein [Clostridium perfringens]MDU1256339.1 hypothetical protein [Clostridium perfringens]
MRTLGKIIMFLSSYAPLYIFIITLNFNLSEIKNSLYKLSDISLINQNDVILYIMILLVIVPNVILKKMLNDTKEYSETIKVINIEEADDKILDYILAYIVTFMTTNYVDFKNSDSKIIFTGLLIQVLLGYLYCRANMFYINPVLNIIYGYHIFVANTENKTIIILSKKQENVLELKKEIYESSYKRIKLNCFSNGIYIYK